jgi:hypothetical protein
MSARSRKEVLGQAGQRYAKRGREGRSRLLEEVCELCGYERKSAIKVLSGKRAIMGSKGRKRGGSQAIYGVTEGEVIKAIWLAAEQPCGKRLKATLKVWLPHYEKRRGRLARRVKQKVLAISAFRFRACSTERSRQVRTENVGQRDSAHLSLTNILNLLAARERRLSQRGVFAF